MKCGLRLQCSVRLGASKAERNIIPVQQTCMSDGARVITLADSVAQDHRWISARQGLKTAYVGPVHATVRGVHSDERLIDHIR